MWEGGFREQGCSVGQINHIGEGNVFFSSPEILPVIPSQRLASIKKRLDGELKASKSKATRHGSNKEDS